MERGGFSGERRVERGERLPCRQEGQQNYSLSTLLSPLSTKTTKLTLLRKNVKHVLTHRILLADFYLLEADEQPKLPSDYIWVDEGEIDNYGVPRLVELLFEAVASHGSRGKNDKLS